MDTEEIKKLEEELSQNLREFAESSKARLGQNRAIIDQQIKNQIEIYSNDIRNLSIISGTIAPFSLTLLTIEKLNSNVTLLILGFFLLLFNVILAQLFIRRHVSDRDIKSVKAEFNLWMAQYQLKEITEGKFLPFDYLKSISESEKLLGVGPFDTEIQKVRSILRRYHKYTNFFFSLGAFCIILSVLIDPLCGWLISNVWLTYAF